MLRFGAFGSQTLCVCVVIYRFFPNGLSKPWPTCMCLLSVDRICCSFYFETASLTRLEEKGLRLSCCYNYAASNSRQQQAELMKALTRIGHCSLYCEMNNKLLWVQSIAVKLQSWYHAR